MNKNPAMLVALAALAAGATVHAQVQDPKPTVVVRSGDSAPGGGFFNDGFRYISINDTGEVVFQNGTTTDYGLFMITGGSSQKIYRDGDAVPGAPTREFKLLASGTGTIVRGSFSAVAAGQVAFRALTTDSATRMVDALGYWVGTPSGLTKIYEAGDAATIISMTATHDFPGSWSDYEESMAVSPGGDIAIHGKIDPTGMGGTLTDVVLRYDGTGLSVEAIEGGIVPGGTDTYERIDDVYINPSDEIFFKFDKDPGGSREDQIYFDGPKVAEGDAVPGFPGDTFASIDNFVTVSSDAGYLFFGEWLCSTCPGGPVSKQGLFRYLGGVGEFIIADGDSAPGTSQTFSDIGAYREMFRMNGDGDIVFVTVTSGFDEGVWKMDAGGSLTKVALTGEPAPGVPSNDFGFGFGAPAIADDGQVFFYNNTDLGIQGIWATDSMGAVYNVMNDAGTIDLGTRCTSDVWDIDSFAALPYNGVERGPQQGRTNIYNQDGEVVLEVEFSQGMTTESGLIVFDTRPCYADLDGDGEATLFDFLIFQTAFDAMDPVADWDCDGSYTSFDFLGYQNDFDACGTF